MHSRERLCTWKRCGEAETEIVSVYRGGYFSVLSGVQMDKQERMELSNHFLSFSKNPPLCLHQQNLTFSTHLESWIPSDGFCITFLCLVWTVLLKVGSIDFYLKTYKWWTDFSDWLMQWVVSALRNQEATWSESNFHSVCSSCLPTAAFSRFGL